MSHTYKILGSAVDTDGWWKYWLKRDDGRVLKVKKARLAELRRRGRITGGDSSYAVTIAN